MLFPQRVSCHVYVYDCVCVLLKCVCFFERVFKGSRKEFCPPISKNFKDMSMWGLLFAVLKAAYLWSFGWSMILAPEQRRNTLGTSSGKTGNISLVLGDLVTWSGLHFSIWRVIIQWRAKQGFGMYGNAMILKTPIYTWFSFFKGEHHNLRNLPFFFWHVAVFATSMLRKG